MPRAGVTDLSALWYLIPAHGASFKCMAQVENCCCSQDGWMRVVPRQLCSVTCLCSRAVQCPTAAQLNVFHQQGHGPTRRTKYMNFQWALFCQSWSSPTALWCGQRFPAAADERQGAITVHLGRFSSRHHRAKAWFKWFFFGQDFWRLWSTLMCKNKPFRRKNITSYYSAIKIHRDI